MSKGTNTMGRNWARLAAVLLACLLAAGYAFLPYQEDLSTVNNSGRKKVEIPTEGEISWEWKPELAQPSELYLTLSGKKKAEGMTVHARLTDENGNEAASAAQPIDELGESDSVVLRGSFDGGKTYTLSVRAEGEGAIKLKGEEDEDGSFFPTLREGSIVTRRNPVMLYFAVGLVLLALTPVRGGGKAPVKETGKRFTSRDLLPLATFLLIFSVGLLVSVHKPAFVADEWQSWDEDIHVDVVKSMTPLGAGSLERWTRDLLTWAPGYIPLALGETLAGLFTQRHESLYMAGVIMSSFAYALMVALAVRHAPKYKVSFLVAGTMPTIMYMMTSMTYDTVVIGSILLGLALLLETLQQDGPVSPLRAMTMTAILAFGTVAKPAYSVAVLALMMIPAEKLGGKGKAWLFRGFVLLMTVWCFVAVGIPGAYDSVRAGDERFAGANASEQIAWIQAHPWEGLTLPFRVMWEDQDYLMNMGLAQWAYLGNDAERVEMYLVLMLLMAPLCIWGEKDEKSLLTPGKRIGLGAIAIGAELILIMTQYIVSSPVGGGYVTGMQARYFIPVWIAMLLAIMAPKAIRNRVGAKAGGVLTWVVFAACAWANVSYAIYRLTSTGMM